MSILLLWNVNVLSISHFYTVIYYSSTLLSRLSNFYFQTTMREMIKTGIFCHGVMLTINYDVAIIPLKGRQGRWSLHFIFCSLLFRVGNYFPCQHANFSLNWQRKPKNMAEPEMIAIPLMPMEMTALRIFSMTYSFLINRRFKVSRIDFQSCTTLSLSLRLYTLNLNPTLST